MSITTINGHMVHFEAFGRGKPIVFVHGWLGSWRYWWPTMQALASHHRSIAFDLWGFGDSGKATGSYTLDSHVEMLHGIVDELGIARPFTLVGHSLGAAVALRYARQNPGSVDRVALVTMPLSSDHVNGQLTGRPAATVLEQSINRYDAFPEVIMGLKKTDVTALDQSVGQIDRLNPADDLREAECPVLLVYGAQDTLIKQPTAVQNEDYQDGPGRYCVSLEDCSHFPMLEQPAVFNRLLRDFMNHPGGSNLAPKDYWQRRTR